MEAKNVSARLVPPDKLSFLNPSPALLAKSTNVMSAIKVELLEAVISAKKDFTLRRIRASVK